LKQKKEEVILKKTVITFIMVLCLFMTALPVIALASEGQEDLQQTETESDIEVLPEEDTELPETETEIESTIEEETETETESVSEEETETETESTSEKETETEPESMGETETEAEAESTSEVETESETENTGETETGTESAGETETETETGSASEEKTETQSSEALPSQKEEKALGYLRITKRDSGNGERLRGAVFGVYAIGTDNSIGELMTDRKGVAELKMEQGDYYLLELAAPDGYELDEEKIRFSIQPGKTTEKNVENRKKPVNDDTAAESGKKAGASDKAVSQGITFIAQPESVLGSTIEESVDSGFSETVKHTTQTDSGKYGTLRIKNAAAGTGRKLSGAVFVVYGDGNKKAGALTLQDGEAALSLPAGDYYLKQQEAPACYGIEQARILFGISAGKTTVVEVTSETDLSNTNPQDIIPKTGEAFPIYNYILSALCFLTAAVSAFAFCRMEKKNRKQGGV